MKTWSFLLTFFAVIFLMFLFLSKLGLMVILTISVSEMSFDCSFYFDYFSCMFFMMVMIVSSSVLIYSNFYMKESLFYGKFMISMVVFILSMVFLILSIDLFWVMVGWDGLGLSSFVLIIFYQNWKSLNSAMVTFLTNRLGDCFILFSMIWFMSLSISKPTGLDFIPNSFIQTLFSLSLLLGGMSKSAQVPFSSWLPLAMAAPTPVSSLVHSSTLVTAGVYLLYRFYPLMDSRILNVLFHVSYLTIFLAGSSAIGEYDLKKVIALSTLSHIGLMMMYLSFESLFAMKLHLFVHAMFKSLLFMIAGCLIHSSSNHQDIRAISINSMDFPLGVSFLVSLFSMIGLPFLSGFFSKELFMVSSSYQGSFIVNLVLITSILWTSSYSMRVLMAAVSKSPMQSHYLSKSENWPIFFIMSVMSICSGGLMYSMMKGAPTIAWDAKSLKMFVFLTLIMGIWIGTWTTYVQGSNKLIFWFSKMWWIDSVNKFTQIYMFKFSWLTLFKNDSKGILDVYFNIILTNIKKVINKFYEKLLPIPMEVGGYVAVLSVLISLLTYFQ